MNKVILAGRLARDPEVRYTQSGKAVASFSIAVSRRFGRNSNNGDQPTADFIPCVAWEKTAEICGNYLRKGSQVCIEGRMQVRSYDAQDGSKRYVTEVVISELEMLGSRSDNSSGSGGGYSNNGGYNSSNGYNQQNNSSAPGNSTSNTSGGFGAPVGDDDIPF